MEMSAINTQLLRLCAARVASDNGGHQAVNAASDRAFQNFLLTRRFTGEDLGFYAYLSGPAPPKDALP
jgi:hypothetical protein